MSDNIFIDKHCFKTRTKKTLTKKSSVYLCIFCVVLPGHDMVTGTAGAPRAGPDSKSHRIPTLSSQKYFSESVATLCWKQIEWPWLLIFHDVGNLFLL